MHKVPTTNWDDHLIREEFQTSQLHQQDSSWKNANFNEEPRGSDLSINFVPPPFPNNIYPAASSGEPPISSFLSSDGDQPQDEGFLEIVRSL